MRHRQLFVIALSLIVATVRPSAGGQDAAETALRTANVQIHAGDFFGAILTLNEVVNQPSAGTPSATLARIHALRTTAYLGMDQPERAQAAAQQALKVDPGIVVDAGEFGAKAAALFASLRAPGANANPEERGRSAERAGRVQDAFLAYVTAYQLLPAPTAIDDDRRLREAIIGAAQKLGTKPVTPPEAAAHLKKADDLLSADAILGGGGTATQEAAAGELRQAVRIAPWWPDPIFRLAMVLQKLQRVDEALVNLDLYKLADPSGFATSVNRANPASTNETRETSEEPKTSAPALIYVFIRKVGLAGRRKLTCDGELVADLATGRFVVLKASPGMHTIAFWDWDTTGMFEAGREHYIRIDVGRNKLSLTLVSPAEAIAQMREWKLPPNDPKNTFRDSCPASPVLQNRK